MVLKNKKAILATYVSGLASGKYTLRQASESTGYTISWLSRLKHKYLTAGDSVFIHKNKGRPALNRISDNIRARIVDLYRTNYKDVNFSYYLDCLKEFEGISVSYNTLRSILVSEGIKSPEAHHVKRRVRVHRLRMRRDCEGDLVQIDGTPFAWFYKSGDLKRYCMAGGIDDATGKITGLYITENECLYGYLEFLKQTCARFGVPREIYSDRAAIFCYTPKGSKLAAWEKLEVIHEKRTQWQRILEELNIRQILAWSPQAKGRVERMWRTLQGQLPQWFFNRGISSVEEANKALGEYIDYFNEKFSTAPAVDDPFWLTPPADLDDILMAQFPRRTTRNGCVTFQNMTFYTPDAVFPCVDITVCISEHGIFARHKGEYFRLLPVEHMVQEQIHDSMPKAVFNIINRYLYSFAKEVSA